MTMRNQMRTKASDGSRTIDFIYRVAPEAQVVCLAGDFSDWNPIAMMPQNGGFRARVKLLPGEHQYRFIVDGEWKNDPAAQSESPNPFGGTNSVIRI